jgi:hypothetical protein
MTACIFSFTFYTDINPNITYIYLIYQLIVVDIDILCAGGFMSKALFLIHVHASDEGLELGLVHRLFFIVYWLGG